MLCTAQTIENILIVKKNISRSTSPLPYHIAKIFGKVDVRTLERFRPRAARPYNYTRIQAQFRMRQLDAWDHSSSDLFNIIMAT